MKWTHRFARPEGAVVVTLEDGRQVELPLFQGLLKHPTADELPALLRRPAVARKYTVEALRRAAWPLLRCFPRDWLLECLDRVALRPGRRRALLFLLGVGD